MIPKCRPNSRGFFFHRHIYSLWYNLVVQWSDSWKRAFQTTWDVYKHTCSQVQMQVPWGNEALKVPCQLGLLIVGSCSVRVRGLQFAYRVELHAPAEENNPTNIGLLKGKGKWGEGKGLTSTLTTLSFSKHVHLPQCHWKTKGHAIQHAPTSCGEAGGMCVDIKSPAGPGCEPRWPAWKSRSLPLRHACQTNDCVV
jgi:hypothetical protein